MPSCDGFGWRLNSFFGEVALALALDAPVALCQNAFVREVWGKHFEELDSAIEKEPPAFGRGRKNNNTVAAQPSTGTRRSVLLAQCTAPICEREEFLPLNCIAYRSVLLNTIQALGGGGGSVHFK